MMHEEGHVVPQPAKSGAIGDLLHPRYSDPTEWVDMTAAPKGQNGFTESDGFIIHHSSSTLDSSFRTEESPTKRGTSADAADGSGADRYDLAFDVTDKDFDVMQSVLRMQRITEELDRQEQENQSFFDESEESKRRTTPPLRHGQRRGTSKDSRDASLKPSRTRSEDYGRARSEDNEDWFEEVDVHVQELISLFPIKAKPFIGCLLCSTVALCCI